MVEVKRITQSADLEKAFAIRQKVFVEEQQVSREDEYDQFEEISAHYLAVDEQGKACGTARWRFTEKGIKLERFAVLKECRSQGVGSKLLEKILKEVYQHPELKDQLIYLHAQLTAVPLYEKFGFRKEGEQFEECAIKHYKMIKK